MCSSDLYNYSTWFDLCALLKVPSLPDAHTTAFREYHAKNITLFNIFAKDLDMTSTDVLHLKSWLLEVQKEYLINPHLYLEPETVYVA